MKPVPIFLKIFLLAGLTVVGLSAFMVFSLKAPKAKAQVGIPVGGFFLPGVPPFGFDIFTAVPPCGLVVTVVGPNPGVFVFMPTLGIYRHFAETPSHIGNNTIALAEPASACGDPTMVMLGSSLAPGIE